MTKKITMAFCLLSGIFFFAVEGSSAPQARKGILTTEERVQNLVESDDNIISFLVLDDEAEFDTYCEEILKDQLEGLNVDYPCIRYDKKVFSFRDWLTIEIKAREDSILLTSVRDKDRLLKIKALLPAKEAKSKIKKPLSSSSQGDQSAGFMSFLRSTITRNVLIIGGSVVLLTLGFLGIRAYSNNNKKKAPAGK